MYLHFDANVRLHAPKAQSFNSAPLERASGSWFLLAEKKKKAGTTMLTWFLCVGQ